MAHNMGVFEVFREIVLAGLVAGGIEGFKNFFKQTGEKAGQQVTEHAVLKSKKIEEHRSECATFIKVGLAGLDPKASKNLLDWISRRETNGRRSYGGNYLPNDGNIAWAALTELYVHLGEIHEEDSRLMIFQLLGRDTDKRRDDFVDMVTHDVIWQTVKRIFFIAKTEGFEPARRAANEIMGGTIKGVRRGLTAVGLQRPSKRLTIWDALWPFGR